MCLGIPLQVVAVQDGLAWCQGQEGRRPIDTLLVGVVHPGDWLLTWQGCAREVIDERRAADIGAALHALELLAQGEHDIDHCFADLAGRTPQLPDFLRKDPAA